MTSDSVIRARFRVAVAVVGAWLAFSLVITAMSASMHAVPSSARGQAVAVNALLTIPWMVFSFLIAAWHQRARAGDRRVWQVAAAHVPLLVILSLADAVVLRAVAELVSGAPLAIPFIATVVYYADFDIVRYAAIVAVTEALLLRRSVVERQQVAAHLEQLLARARLDHLEAQMQPHFLFNALGTVSELAVHQPDLAARVARQLAAIVRHAMSTRADEVALGVELIGVEPYLDIQRLRFRDWLSIDYHISADALECRVPRFVLQPLVENAIRHGLTGRRAAGTIRLTARVDEATLIIAVTDNGVGLRAAATSGNRLGLANIRDRLAILYEDASSLRLFDSDTGGATAEVRIPAHRGPAPEAPNHAAELEEADSLESAAEGPPTPQWRRRGLTVLAIWLACGLLWSQQSFIYVVLRGRLGHDSWLSITARDMTNGLIWALLTPAVLLAARRLPLRRRFLPLRLVGYALSMAVVALAHAFVLARITNPSTAVWSPAYEMTMLVNVLILLVLIAVAHRREFADWLRARDATAAQLRDQLVVARHRVRGLQAVSPVLVRSLEVIARQIESYPSRVEDTIGSLGDYLRVAMEGGVVGLAGERADLLAPALMTLERRIGTSLTLVEVP